MTSIPARDLVRTTPSVIGVGGSALQLVALMLTASTRIPINTVANFASAESVGEYFGAASDEATLAAIYFTGFDNSTKKPANLLMAQYNAAAVSAFLRGGDASGLTLAALQAITGVLTATVDGAVRTVSSLNISSATSFSNAAALITTALNAVESTIASLTGAISGTTLTVSAVGSGTLAVGQQVKGSGVLTNTVITALGSGTGGTGTYTVSRTQTVGSEAMTTAGADVVVTYDSTSGGFVITSTVTGAASTMAFATGSAAAPLFLTSATGAVISQGAAAASPAGLMNTLIAVNNNFVTFMTTFDPDNGSGFAVKQAFAVWKNTALGGKRFAYVCWDPDLAPSASQPATGTLGAALVAISDSGTCLIGQDATAAASSDTLILPKAAAFVCGACASIDTDAAGGRITFAYKAQAGMTATVTSETAANNLGGSPQAAAQGNGYNFYGAYAEITNFTWFQRGLVTGDYVWLDSYINQIWWCANARAAMLNLLGTINSVPYTPTGRALIEGSLSSIINQGLSFGMYAPGPLSGAEQSAINASAGASIAPTIQTQGYYLQIKPSSPSVRAARTSPPMKFFYLDDGAVQALDLAVIEAQ